MISKVARAMVLSALVVACRRTDPDTVTKEPSPVVAHVTSAPVQSTTAPSGDLRTAELEDSIRELEATAATTTDPATKQQLDAQIASLKSTRDLVRSLQPAFDEAKQHRPALSPEMAAFFTPKPAAQVPTWVPSTLRRADVNASVLRCGAGVSYYDTGDSVSCALAGVPGAKLSRGQGLALQFHPAGGLRSQTFYEGGAARWAISYHPNGVVESVGFYVGPEPHDWIEDGLHTRYASNGVVVSQSEWKQGKLNGWQKLWEDDGFPIVGTRYVDGVAVETASPDGTRVQR